VKCGMIVGITALLLACGAALASQWVQVGTGKDGTKVWVDTSSITVTSSIRQALLKMTDRPPENWTNGNVSIAAKSSSGLLPILMTPPLA
jgi:hypothetical protein